MKKILLSLALLTASFTQAQVGFGTPTPDANAAVEISSDNKGLLIPRVALVSTDAFAPMTEHVAGMIVYNTTSTDKESEDYNPNTAVQPGLYQNDGTKWVQLVAANTHTVRFFYMPSIVINTSTNGQFTIDLYQQYVDQFSSVPDVQRNPSAPQNIPFFQSATDLYYYVTDYDTTALEIVEISDTGELTYNVIGTGTDYSFVNIVFVVK